MSLSLENIGLNKLLLEGLAGGFDGFNLFVFMISMNLFKQAEPPAGTKRSPGEPRHRDQVQTRSHQAKDKKTNF